MKILIFAPHSGIWPHAFPEALIAESLKKSGHEITYVTCEESYTKFCTVMAAFGYTNDTSETDKKRACEKCKGFGKLILNEFGFSHRVLKNYVSKNEIDEIDLILTKITQENIIDFSIDGVEIGRLTLYQLLLEYKKNTLNFLEHEWKRVLVDLRNALFTYYGMSNLLASDKPDAVIVYNSLYSVNHTFAKLAEKNNIKQYFLHAGVNFANRLETMILGEGDGFKYYKSLVRKWHDFKHIPCTEELISKVTAHLLTAIKGGSIFSYSQGVGADQVDVRSHFNIAKNQKLILATMSSNDERYAGAVVKAYTQSDQVLFPDQINWLTNIIDYVRNRPELFLVIRVHPREFPNKRESVVSENYSKMITMFEELPVNVKINWPNDNISLYHLAQETDLCLNSWSSAGKELAALGIPVLLYSEEIQFYPTDINYLGQTKVEYFDFVEKLLQIGWDFERIRKVFRWYAFEYFRTTIDISDSFNVSKTNIFNKGYQKFMAVFTDSIIQKRDCKKRKPHLKAESTINQIIENKNGSILDILNDIHLSCATLHDETAYLNKYLNKIYQVLLKNSKNETPLLRNFQNYLQSMEREYA